MIQRIQTLFLLSAGIFLVFMFFFPFAELVRSSDQVLFSIDLWGLNSMDSQNEVVFRTIPVAILLIISFLLTFITIFLYRKRMLQVRLCIFNIIIQVGLPGLIFYYVHMAQSNLPGMASYSVFFVFPWASAILIFLALRAIARDEAIVRSLDRLR